MLLCQEVKSQTDYTKSNQYRLSPVEGAVDIA